MLEVKEINQFYGGSHILRDVSFQAPVGECSVILGRNGVGKTTLLNILLGVIPLSTGEIKLGGISVRQLGLDLMSRSNGTRHETAFTVSIEARDRRAFEAAGLDLLALEGADVRVRGWIYAMNGPAITIDHPERLEILTPP